MPVERSSQGSVVVGIAHSLAGLAALRYAVDEARRRGTPLRAVVALTPITFAGETAGPTADAQVQAARDAMEAFYLAMGVLPHDVAVNVVVGYGRVAAVLHAQSMDHADLLVVGTSGRSRLLRPSTVDAICRLGPGCPVVAVPAPAMAQGCDVAALGRSVVREASMMLALSGTGTDPASR